MASQDLNERLKGVIDTFLHLNFSRLLSSLDEKSHKEFEDYINYLIHRLSEIDRACHLFEDKISRDLSAAILRFNQDFSSISITVDGVISPNEVGRISNFFRPLLKVLEATRTEIDVQLLKLKMDEIDIGGIESRKLEIESIAYALREEAVKAKLSNDDLTRTMSEIEAKVNELAPELSFLDQARLFGYQAKKYGKHSFWWLVMSVLVSITIVSVLWYFVFCFHKDQQFLSTNLGAVLTLKSELGDKPEYHWILFYEIFKGIFYRAIFLSVLIYLFFFCARNYFASRHNATINEQKQNSLKVILFLYDKSDGNQKSEIIKMALPIIVSHQPSGFNKKDQGSVLNFGGVKEIVLGGNGQG